VVQSVGPEFKPLNRKIKKRKRKGMVALPHKAVDEASISGI
jgi:hypothetical protein